jgi:hypothetical protein
MPRYRITLSSGTTEEIEAESADVLQQDDRTRGRGQGDLVFKGVPGTERTSGHYRKGEWESYEQIPDEA